MDKRNEQTMEQAAAEWAESLVEYVKPYVDGTLDDPYDHEDDHPLPEMYGHDMIVRIHCYGGGPAGGVEFDVQRASYGLEYQGARVWHQDWFQPKGYSGIDDETAEFLFNHWGISMLLEHSDY